MASVRGQGMYGNRIIVFSQSAPPAMHQASRLARWQDISTLNATQKPRQDIYRRRGVLVGLTLCVFSVDIWHNDCEGSQARFISRTSTRWVCLLTWMVR